MILALCLAVEALFVQASSVRVRSSADASAAVVREVPIGSRCAELEAARDGWAKVDCEGSVGFAKAELFGQAPPNLAALRATAEDESQPVPGRMTALSRATALSVRGPDRSDVRELWTMFRPLFFKAERARLEEAREAGKTLKKAKQLRGKCYDGSYKECFQGALYKEGDFFVVDSDGEPSGVFVFAALQLDGKLAVTSGSFETQTYDAGQIAGVRMSVQPELTYTTTPDASVLRGLLIGTDDSGSKYGSSASPRGCAKALHGGRYSRVPQCDPSLEAFPACEACVARCAATCYECRAAKGPDCDAPVDACVKACTAAR